MEKVTPLVSVVMTTYNTDRFLAQAIKSVLEQTIKNFELIVVDDGSTDTTPAILSEVAYFDKRVRVLTNRANLGIPKSANRGIGEACGEFIARMDADDICHPDRFAKQLAFMRQNPNLIACGSSALIIDEEGKVIADRYMRRSVFQYRLLSRFDVGLLHPTAFIRTSVIREKGISYSADLDVSQDVDFFFRLQKYGDIVVLPDRLLKYRIHSSSASLARRPIQIDNHRRMLLSRRDDDELLAMLSEADLRLVMDTIFFRERSPSPMELYRMLTQLSQLCRKICTCKQSEDCCGCNRPELLAYKLGRRAANLETNRIFRYGLMLLVLLYHGRLMPSILREYRFQLKTLEHW